MIEDQDGGDEGENIREQLDNLWSLLNTEEQELTRSSSEDLYTLWKNNNENKQIESKNTGLINLIFENLRQDNFIEALKLCRENEKELNRDFVDALRGIIWFKLGIVKIAKRFYDHALKIKPKDKGSYRDSG